METALNAEIPSSEEEGEGSAVPDPGRAGQPTETPSWLQPILRILAETQHELATKVGSVKPRAALATLRLEEFRGGRETTTHQYRAWRKQMQITQRLYGLPDAELALIIYTQVKGRAKHLLEVLEVTDLEKPGGREMVWQILDRAHERMEHERADDAYSAWESAHRKPGQSMDEWLTYLRKTKLEV